MTKIRFPLTTKRLSLFVVALLIVALVITVNNGRQKQETQTHAAGANPMLFGTNLTLIDAADQFLTSAQTRAAMQQMHIATVRMPIRSVGPPSQAEIQAAQDIKAMGAIPLVILKYSQTDPAGAGIQVVQAMNQIFGSSTVYYEFGNEQDLANHVTQQQYTTAWNLDVPRIKAAAPNGKFGGPTNFQQNPPYIAYFVQNANPTPDFISWHEYTCGNSTAAATCIANIAHWSTHITATKTAIQATGKAVPPIFITEWNYDATNPVGDPRATPQFELQFATTALQELAKDGVTAAYHYVVTGHTEYNLVDPSGKITPAGQAFQQTFAQLIGTGPGVSGTVNTSPTPVVPTLFCLGSCPTGSPTGTVLPSSGTSNPGTGQQNISPATSGTQIQTPCAITQSVTSESKQKEAQEHKSKHKKKNNDNDNNNGSNQDGLLSGLLQQLIKWLEQLLQQLGGGSTPTPCNPTGTPSIPVTSPANPLSPVPVTSGSPVVSPITQVSPAPSQ